MELNASIVLLIMFSIKLVFPEGGTISSVFDEINFDPAPINWPFSALIPLDSPLIKLKSNSKKISTMIIGEVIGIYINNKFINNNRIDSVSMRYIARMGYSEYTTVISKFNLKRK